MTTSCTLDAKEGMIIRTNSEKIRNLRRKLAELLVAEVPNSRAIQDLAARCGVTEVRYPFRNHDCVLCGPCVRVCEEMWQARALGFVGRGKERRVEFPFGVKPEEIFVTYETPVAKYGKDKVAEMPLGAIGVFTFANTASSWSPAAYGRQQELLGADHRPQRPDGAD